MQIGCAATPEDVNALINAGYDYVEFSARRICGMTAADFSSMISQLEQKALPCLGLNIYCPPDIVIAGPGFDARKAEEYALRCAGRASILGVRHIGVGSPRSRTLPVGFSSVLADRQIREFLNVTADVFGKHGITVCLEALGPCYCNYINRISQAADIIKELKHPFLGIVPDFYNMEHSGEDDLDLTTFLPYIRHVHTSDDDGDPSRRYFFKKEKSALHIARVHNLRKTGYDATISVEIDLAVREEDAVRTLAILREACK